MRSSAARWRRPAARSRNEPDLRAAEDVHDGGAEGLGHQAVSTEGILHARACWRDRPVGGIASRSGPACTDVHPVPLGGRAEADPSWQGHASTRWGDQDGRPTPKARAPRGPYETFNPYFLANFCTRPSASTSLRCPV